MPDSNGWNHSSTSSGWSSSNSNRNEKSSSNKLDTWNSNKTDATGFTVGVSIERDLIKNKIESMGKTKD